MWNAISSLFTKKSQKKKSLRLMIIHRERYECDRAYFLQYIRPVLAERMSERPRYEMFYANTRCLWMTRFQIIDRDGVVIFARDGFPTTVAREWQVAFDRLSIGLQNGTITQTEDGFFRIPDILAVRWNPEVLSVLGWHNTSGIRAYIRSRGSFVDRDYSIIVKFEYNDTPLHNVRYKGMEISVGERVYTLSLDVLMICDAYARFLQARKSGIDQVYAWARLKSELNQGGYSFDDSSDIALITANRFTLSMSSKGQLRPIMLKAERTYGDEVIQESLLSTVQNDRLYRAILKESDNKKYFSLGVGTYLIVSDELAEVLRILRSVMLGSTRQQWTMYHDPVRYVKMHVRRIRRDLRDRCIDLVASMFVETDEYLSQRIRAFGEWNPKTLSFKTPPSINWYGGMSSDALVIYEDSGVIFLRKENTAHSLSLAEVKKVLAVIEDALACGRTHAVYSGVRIPATLMIEQWLRHYIDVMQSQERSRDESTVQNEGNSTETEPKKKKRKRLGPQLKSNLRQLDFVARRNAHPEDTHPLPILAPGVQLFPHQEESFTWLQSLWQKGYSGALLADDMGLGKTLQCLTFASWLKTAPSRKNVNRPILIIAPVSLLNNWAEEGKRFWGHVLGRPEILTSKAAKQLRWLTVAERNDAIARMSWVITNYDTVRQYNKIFLTTNWSLVVLDEAQHIKTPTSIVTECVKALKTDFLLAMTGTPVENKFLDLWSIMDAAMPGVLGAAKDFARQYRADNESALAASGQELHDLLMKSHGDRPAFILRRMKTEEQKRQTGGRKMTLPQKTRHVVRCIMPEVQRQNYQAILHADECALVKLQHLARAAFSPFIVDESRSFTEKEIGMSARLMALFEILDAIYKKGEKALIFTQRISVQKALLRTIRDRYHLAKLPGFINGDMRTEVRHRVVQEFQNGPEGVFDVLVLSSRAAGTGFTMTAANHVIHLERWWNPAVEDQCSDRAYRIGQTKDVTIHLPMAVLSRDDVNQSFDANIHTFLSQKRYRSQSFLMPSFARMDNGELSKWLENTRRVPLRKKMRNKAVFDRDIPF